VSNRTTHVVLATVVSLILSASAGLIAAYLPAAVPFSIRVTAFCYTAAPLLMLCLITGGPLLDRAERRRTRKARR
jgi:cation transport ATPase